MTETHVDVSAPERALREQVAALHRAVALGEEALREFTHTVRPALGPFTELHQRLHAFGIAMPALSDPSSDEPLDSVTAYGLASTGGGCQHPLTPDEFLEALHPDDVTRVADAWESGHRSGKRYRVDFRLHGQGDYRWFVGCGVPFRDAVGERRQWFSVAEGADPTAMNEALRESEQRFRTMADGLPLVVWVHDPAGQQQFVNRTFCEFFGIEPQETAGGGWQMLIHPDDAEAYTREFLDCVTRLRPFHSEVRVRNAAGDWRWIESWSRPRLSPSGECLGFVGTSVDISERKRLEETLRQSDRRKDEFLAVLAHELRNPLAPIATAAGILTGNTDPVVARCRDVISRQTAQMARLLDDLIDIARVSRGKLALRRARVLLKDVVEAAIETARPLLERHGHTLTVSHPDEPVALEADAARLTQVFSNLLTNAAKFTSPRGQIHVEMVATTPDAVTVSVRDSGRGIPSILLDRVFDLFTQGDGVGAESGCGLGVGLALVRQLVEMHGGTIQAFSEGPGQGSTFTVRLPRPGAGGHQPPVPDGRERPGRPENERVP